MPRHVIGMTFAVLAIWCVSASGQQQTPPLPVPPPSQPPPDKTVIAATVNGQAIPELAVYRALVGLAPAKQAEYRPEVLNYLIDNALVDQYLDQMKIDVDVKEVDKQFEKVKGELQAKGKKLEDVYSSLFLTEADLRAQLSATLRWEKFIKQYGTDEVLRKFFETNKAIFDGSAMRAKHILISVPPANPQAAEDAKAKIIVLKSQIAAKVNQGMAAAGSLDSLEMQKTRRKLLEKTFAEVAAKESTCPTKDHEGELGWFPRVGGGRVSEAFAKAAFGMKLFELSEPVLTEYGYHLILCLDYKAGVEPKFEQIRDVVRDVYADKLREAVLVERMRPNAKIIINPVK